MWETFRRKIIELVANCVITVKVWSQQRTCQQQHTNFHKLTSEKSLELQSAIANSLKACIKHVTAIRQKNIKTCKSN